MSNYDISVDNVIQSLLLLHKIICLETVSLWKLICRNVGGTNLITNTEENFTAGNAFMLKLDQFR